MATLIKFHEKVWHETCTIVLEAKGSMKIRKYQWWIKWSRKEYMALNWCPKYGLDIRASDDDEKLA